MNNFIKCNYSRKSCHFKLFFYFLGDIYAPQEAEFRGETFCSNNYTLNLKKREFDIKKINFSLK